MLLLARLLVRLLLLLLLLLLLVLNLLLKLLLLLLLLGGKVLRGEGVGLELGHLARQLLIVSVQHGLDVFVAAVRLSHRLPKQQDHLVLHCLHALSQVAVLR